MEGRFIPFAAVVTTAALLVTACTSGQSKEPTSTPPPSSTITIGSPTPSGTPTTGPNVSPGDKPPVLSISAKQHSATGALNFANFYYEAFDWSIATNNPSMLASVSAPSCKTCAAVINDLKALQQSGDTLTGGRIDVQTASLVTGTFRFHSDYVVQATVSEGAEIRQGPTSPPSTVASAYSDEELVFVSWFSTGWKIVEVALPS